MPIPYAPIITLTPRQKQILEGIIRQKTNPHRLVQRAQLIVGAASDKNNTELSAQLSLSRTQVQCWRDRWQDASESLSLAESEQMSEAHVRERIESILSDKIRPGTKAAFSVEQIVQIVAIACEQPASSNRPVSHWSPRELAHEAIKRGIVTQISPRTVGRFLKGGCFTTASRSVLAQCQSR